MDKLRFIFDLKHIRIILGGKILTKLIFDLSVVRFRGRQGSLCSSVIQTLVLLDRRIPACSLLGDAPPEPETPSETEAGEFTDFISYRDTNKSFSTDGRVVTATS